MIIGVFDSGLGGLFILKSLVKKFPRYDFLYLGDTKNLPYGDKTQKQIFDLTKKSVKYLFDHHCALVIVACNTASSQALRKLQREWLRKSKYKDRRLLGIIRPTVENLKTFRSAGIIGTRRTIDSFAYSRELENVNSNIKLIAKATPELVPMIENGRLDHTVVEKSLASFKAKKIDALILACTHYGIIKKDIQKILGKKVKVIAQEDILPQKLKSYLNFHPEISRKLSKNAKIDLRVTMLTSRYETLARDWFGKNSKLIIAKY